VVSKIAGGERIRTRIHRRYRALPSHCAQILTGKSIPSPDPTFTDDYDGDQGDTIRFGDNVFGAIPDGGTAFQVTYRVGGAYRETLPPILFETLIRLPRPESTAVTIPSLHKTAMTRKPTSACVAWRLRNFVPTVSRRAARRL